MTAAIDTKLTIRAIGDEGEIEGYIFVFGDTEHRDAYDTFVDPAAPPDLALEFLPQPIYYEHGDDPAIGKERIGKVVSAWVDKAGIKFRGFLDKSSQFFDRVIGELRQGLLRTSSGTAGHLAEFDDEGRFVRWPLVDLSLTQNPAESRMPQVNLLRSENGQRYVRFQSVESARDEAIGGRPATAPHESETTVPEQSRSDISKGKKTMANKTEAPAKRAITNEQLGLDGTATLDQVYAAIVDMIGEEAAKIYWQTMGPGAAAPEAPEDGAPQEMLAADAARSKKVAKPAAPSADSPVTRADIEAAIKAAMAAPPAEEPKTVRTEKAVVSVGEELRYSDKSLRDMAFAYLVMRSRNLKPSDAFMRNLGGKAAAGLEKGDKYINNIATRSALNGATRANEIAISTAAGGGDEWVSVYYGSEPWLQTRNETVLIDMLMAKGMMVEEVPQGAESIIIPTEGSDPTVYTIAQNADATSGRPTVNVGLSRIGTGKATLTPGELGAAVAWSDVFDEDSIVRVSTRYNVQCTTKLTETVVQLWINGDVTPTINTNINLIDGTPGTGTSTPYYIASNGALKYALVTGSGTSRDGGALDEDDYRLTLKLMTAPTRSRLGQLVYVIDVDTHSASLDIAAIKTDDVRRTNATITSGVLTNIFGIDVHQTGFMPLANNVGKVPGAGGTLGRILCAYAPYWAMGWKRHITIETDRDILTGANILVAKMRVGFLARGADAATVTYNLTV